MDFKAQSAPQYGYCKRCATRKAAAVQMVSGTHPETNIDTMRRLVREAAERGADWVLLPEYWPLMGARDTDKLAFAEPLGAGAFQTAMSEIARECNIVLFGGTVPLQSGEAGKVLNTLLVYGRDGAPIGAYDKMHLFGYSGLGERYAEADTIAAGAAVPRLSADGINVAAGVCYDVRFPEFFRAQQPFEVLLLPLYIPVLIFATSAIDAASMGLPYGGQLAILGAMLVGALTLTPLAISAALRVSVN